MILDKYIGKYQQFGGIKCSVNKLQATIGGGPVLIGLNANCQNCYQNVDVFLPLWKLVASLLDPMGNSMEILNSI